MDPTANLQEQLRIAKRIANGRDADSVRLADLVIALNEWITRGGFLPAPWAAAQRADRQVP